MKKLLLVILPLLMAAQMLVQQNTTASKPLVFFMASATDHITGAVGLSPTVTLHKSGAGSTWVSPSGSVTELGSGWYQLVGSNTDSNTLGDLLLHATSGTTADPADALFQVVAYNPYATDLGIGPSKPGDKMDLADTVNATGVADLKTKLGTVPASGNWNTTTPPTVVQIRTEMESGTGAVLPLMKAVTDKITFTGSNPYYVKADVVDYGGSSAPSLANLSHLDVDVSSRLAPGTLGRTLAVDASGNVVVGGYASQQDPLYQLTQQSTYHFGLTSGNKVQASGDWNTATPPAVSDIAGAVWDLNSSTHGLTGSFGLMAQESHTVLKPIGTSLVSQTANAVWDAAPADHTIDPSFGKSITTIGSAVGDAKTAALSAEEAAANAASLAGNAAKPGDKMDLQSGTITAIQSGLMQASNYTAPHNTNIDAAYAVLTNPTYGNQALNTAIGNVHVSLTSDQVDALAAAIGASGISLSSDQINAIVNAVVAAGYVAPASARSANAAVSGTPAVLPVVRGSTTPWNILLYSGKTPLQVPSGTRVYAGLTSNTAGADALDWDTSTGSGITLAYVGSNTEPARVTITLTAAQSLALHAGTSFLTVWWIGADGSRNAIFPAIRVEISEAAGEIQP